MRVGPMPTPIAAPAAVVFDAIEAARARGTEIVLADTAGRLQNQDNLMPDKSYINLLFLVVNNIVRQVL